MTAQIISFILGIVSSLVASWLLFLRERSRFRLRFGAVLDLIMNLAKQMEVDAFVPEYIVTVDRNSGVVGSILSGAIGLKSIVSVSTVNERLPDGSRTIRLDDVSQELLPLLAKKRILVLICCNDSGTSLGFVVSSLRGLGEYAPAEIKTAALYTSYSPAIMPTYRSVTLGRDIRGGMDRIISRLPWMTSQWHHVFATERLSKK